MRSKSETGTKLKSLIGETNKIEQKQLFTFVYWCGIPLTTVGFCTRLHFLPNIV